MFFSFSYKTLTRLRRYIICIVSIATTTGASWADIIGSVIRSTAPVSKITETPAVGNKKKKKKLYNQTGSIEYLSADINKSTVLKRQRVKTNWRNHRRKWRSSEKETTRIEVISWDRRYTNHSVNNRNIVKRQRLIIYLDL